MEEKLNINLYLDYKIEGEQVVYAVVISMGDLFTEFSKELLISDNVNNQIINDAISHLKLPCSIDCYLDEKFTNFNFEISNNNSHSITFKYYKEDNLDFKDRCLTLISKHK